VFTSRYELHLLISFRLIYVCSAYIMRTSTEGTHVFRHKTNPVYPHVKYIIFYTAEYMGCLHFQPLPPKKKWRGGGTGGTTQGQKHISKPAKNNYCINKIGASCLEYTQQVCTRQPRIIVTKITPSQCHD